METAGVRYCQTECERRSQPPGLCRGPSWDTADSDKGGQRWSGCLQSGTAPAPRGPGQGDSVVGKGAVSPGTELLLLWLSPILLSPPEPRGACCLWEQTSLVQCCRFGRANPSDMRRSCLAERKRCSLDQLTRTAFPPSLGPKLIVLVLPV